MHTKVENKQWKKACLEKWDQQCLENYYQLKDRKKSSSCSETTKGFSRDDQEIVHTISQYDTLEGLSLMYNVNINSIIQRNRLHSNQIYYLSNLIIPNPNVIANPNPQSQQIYVGHKEKLIERLRLRLKLDINNRHLVQQVLEQSSWDIQAAARKYAADVEWKRRYGDILCVFESRKKKKPIYQNNTAHSY